LRSESRLFSLAVLPGSDYSRFQFAENSIYRICFCGENVLSDDFLYGAKNSSYAGYQKQQYVRSKLGQD